MTFSYIIPSLNEARLLPRLLQRLSEGMEAQDEIIVVDGGSEDDTVEIVKKRGLPIITSKSGRSIQMNAGAAQAKGELLFFIHADTLPPMTFRADIVSALAEGADAGCFRYRFDAPSFLLRVNAYFTRFPMIWCRGGDQGLFIRKTAFQALGGFDESHQIMEDYEFILRIKKAYDFNIIPKYFVVSARKYESNSYIRVQWANFLVFRAFNRGASQEKMIQIYKHWLHLP